MKWTKFVGRHGTSYHSMEPNGYVIDEHLFRSRGRPFDLARISTSPHGVTKAKLLGSFRALTEAKEKRSIGCAFCAPQLGEDLFMGHRQAIETKYLGPTNHRGGRIKASAQAGSITIPWDHALNTDNNHDMAAIALLKKLGWKGKLEGGGNARGNGNVYVFIEGKR